jgi:hypothetical protein
MVMIVAVVVTQDATVINPTNTWIDIREAVLDNLSFLGLPNFFLEDRTAPWPSQIESLISETGASSPQSKYSADRMY